MRTILAITTCIMVIAVIHGPVTAQTKKIKGLDLNAPVKPANDKPFIPDPYKEAAKQGTLTIKQIHVRSAVHAITTTLTVTGVYHNDSRYPVSSATYSIEMSRDGAQWFSIRKGSLPAVLPNQGSFVAVQLPLSNSVGKFRFVVSPSVEKSKEYRLNYWVLRWHCETPGSEFIGSRWENEDKYLRSIGFQTASAAGWVRYSAPGWREWAFMTRADALYFLSTLPKKGVESRGPLAR